MTLMTTCTRYLEFDAAHRVMRHESKCATLHGHRYKVAVCCQAPKLDDVGRVVDFGVVKAKVGAWIDEHWDHTTIANEADVNLLSFVEDEHATGKRAPFVFPGEPTAENMAMYLLHKAQELLGDDSGLTVVHVRVWETPNCYADAHRILQTPIDPDGFPDPRFSDTVPSAT